MNKKEIYAPIKSSSKRRKEEVKKLMGGQILDVMRSMIGEEYVIDGKTYLLTDFASKLGLGTFDGWVAIDITHSKAFKKDGGSYFMFFPQEIFIDIIKFKLKKYE
jgi:hypothetical protein